MACVASLLLTLTALLIYQAHALGITVDEPSHLLSAHLYWKGQDNLKPQDMPPVIKIAGGWVSLFFDLPVPRDHPVWQRNHEWPIAAEMIQKIPLQTLPAYVFWSRVPFVLFPAATVLLIWWWARQWVTPWAAMAAAAVYAFEPTALGHGALFKNDLAAAFAYVLFSYCAWRYWREPGRRRVAWLGVSAALGLCTKLSMVILAPLSLVVIAGASAYRWRPLRNAALDALLCLAIATAIIGTAYQWKLRTWTVSEAEQLLAGTGLMTVLPVASWFLAHIPAPGSLVEGVTSLLRDHGSPYRTWFWGELIPGGTRLYFLGAGAVKATLVFQLLLVVSLVLLFMRRMRGRFGEAAIFVLLPAALYAGLASLSVLQLGYRLVLPALALLALLTAFAIDELIQRQARIPAIAAGIVLALHIAPCLMHYPNTMSYFNAWAGGPRHALDYLSDSNVDWGQNLRALADYQNRNGIDILNVSYFGTDRLERYFQPGRVNVIVPPWGSPAGKPERLRPRRGYYAISTTLLTGSLFDPRLRDYYKIFRDSEPDAYAGWSIYIYRVP